jgi:Nucleoside-diphosphate-sugar epimerases
MKVFLTGGTGMLGRAVRNRLEASNHKVFSFGSKDFDLVDDPHKVIKKLYLVNPDVVVHCAGTVGGVKANIESPATFLRENLLMGMNLLQGMAEAGVKRIIKHWDKTVLILTRNTH